MSIYPPDMKPTGTHPTCPTDKKPRRFAGGKIKRLVIMGCVGLLAVGFMVLKNDKELKRSAKETIVELCANYEYVDKLKLDGALTKLNAAIERVKLLSVDQEQQAASFVRGFQSSLEWAENDVASAKDFLSKADNDYAKQRRREALNQEKNELEQKKKEFSEKMRIVLNAY